MTLEEAVKPAALRTALGERPTRVRRIILALACATSLLLYLHRYTWGFVKPDIQRRFAWDDEAVGWLDGLFHLTYAIGQIPSGILCDWFGARTLIPVIIVLWSVALTGFAVAASLPAMAASRLLFGLTQAGAYPCLSKVSKVWIPPSTRTVAQGWIATFFGRSGGALSNVVLGTLLIGGLGLSWQQGLVAMSALGIVLAATFILLFRDSPREHPWVNREEAELIEQGAPVAAAVRRTRVSWRAVFTSGNMWLIFLQVFVAVCSDNFYVNWLPKYLRQHLSLDESTAGKLLFLPLFASAVGGVLGAAMQDWLRVRTGNPRWARRLPAATGSLLALSFLASSLVVETPLAIVALIAFAKFFADFSQPTVWGTVTDIAGPNAASVFAAVNTAGAVAGVMVGPATGQLLGWLSSGADTSPVAWQALFAATSLLYLVAALLWLKIDCTRLIEPPHGPHDGIER